MTTEEERDGYTIRRGAGMEDFEPVTEPLEHTRCPECGTRPDDESVAMHRLASNGYTHDDVWLDCAADDCDNRWVLGIPIGEPAPERYEDLVCGCGDIALVHRVQVLAPKAAAVKLHLKCPSCFTFWMVKRELDGNSVTLIGHPAITGDTAHDSVKPYGYTDE